MIDLFSYWHWLILAVVLLILEVVTGGGFLFWIGIAAFIVGLITALIPQLSWAFQLGLFALSSILVCVLWWHHVRKRLSVSEPMMLNRRSEQFVGREFSLETAIENGRGRVKIGDSIWRVVGESMPAGTKVTVVSVDGVLLHVEKSVS